VFTPACPSACLPACLPLQAFTLVIMYRCWHLLTPPTTAWLLASLALALGDLAWRALWPGSYVRWRELPAALLRLAAFGPPAAWLLMGQLLEDHGAPSASSSGSGGAAPGGSPPDTPAVCQRGCQDGGKRPLPAIAAQVGRRPASRGTRDA
jgi:hypothetical protein